jgi:hypothetical protein
MTGSHALPVATSDGGTTRERRRRLFIVPAVALTTATMVALGAGAASAASDPDPLGNVVKAVHTTVHPAVHRATHGGKPATSSRTKEGAASHRSASGSQRPAGTTDYASSSAGHLQAADQDVLDLSRNDSSGTKDATSANATLLAVGGTTIIGSEASSGGANEGHSAFPQIPLCQPTDGAVCLDLLYADSSASDSGSSSRAGTSTGVADACLGGDGVSDGTCNGQHVGLVQGTSSLERSSGHNTATSWTSIANFCLQPGADGCTVDGNVLSSNGRADTESGSSGSSTLAEGQLSGTPASAPNDPVTVAVPTDCASPSLVCVFLNQGDNGVTGPVTSTSQTVVEVSGLGDQLGGTAANAETGTTAVDDTAIVSPPTHTQNNPPAGTTTKASSSDVAGPAGDGLLPATGGVWSGLLSLGLLLVGAGATAMAWTRRRRVA